MRTTTLMSAAATDADNNSTGDNANTGSWQHQHHLLPPRSTTHHHLPPLHHPPTRAYAYTRFRGWLLFAMTMTMTTFHHPPLASNTRRMSGCCLPRPTTIFHHPLMRVYAYTRFRGWCLIIFSVQFGSGSGEKINPRPDTDRSPDTGTHGAGWLLIYHGIGIGCRGQQREPGC